MTQRWDTKRNIRELKEGDDATVLLTSEVMTLFWEASTGLWLLNIFVVLDLYFFVRRGHKRQTLGSLQ